MTTKRLNEYPFRNLSDCKYLNPGEDDCTVHLIPAPVCAAADAVIEAAEALQKEWDYWWECQLKGQYAPSRPIQHSSKQVRDALAALEKVRDE